MTPQACSPPRILTSARLAPGWSVTGIVLIASLSGCSEDAENSPTWRETVSRSEALAYGAVSPPSLWTQAQREQATQAWRDQKRSPAERQKVRGQGAQDPDDAWLKQWKEARAYQARAADTQADPDRRWPATVVMVPRPSLAWQDAPADPGVMSRINGILDGARSNLQAYEQRQQLERAQQGANEARSLQQTTRAFDDAIRRLQRSQEEQLRAKMNRGSW